MIHFARFHLRRVRKVHWKTHFMSCFVSHVLVKYMRIAHKLAVWMCFYLLTLYNFLHCEFMHFRYWLQHWEVESERWQQGKLIWKKLLDMTVRAWYERLSNFSDYLLVRTWLEYGGFDLEAFSYIKNDNWLSRDRLRYFVFYFLKQNLNFDGCIEMISKKHLIKTF